MKFPIYLRVVLKEEIFQCNTELLIILRSFSPFPLVKKKLLIQTMPLFMFSNYFVVLREGCMICQFPSFSIPLLPLLRQQELLSFQKASSLEICLNGCAIRKSLILQAWLSVSQESLCMVHSPPGLDYQPEYSFPTDFQYH